MLRYKNVINTLNSHIHLIFTMTTRENDVVCLLGETGDALDAASACKTTDGRLGDSLDVITKNLAVTLGASLSEPLASLAASSHGESMLGAL